jgi:hypothetical protein
MKVNREGLADALGVTAVQVDRNVRDGMPMERRGRKGVASCFDVAACIRWLRARDAARASARSLPPRLAGHPREPRADREERRDILRSLWLPSGYWIPWSHPHVEPLDRFEEGLGIDAHPGEVLDLMALGLPILPPRAIPALRLPRLRRVRRELPCATHAGNVRVRLAS